MLPQTLYKYLEPQHADGLVERGSVRFGTYADYRRIEAYGEEIGDAEEGVARYAMRIPDRQEFSGRSPPGIVRHFFAMGPDDELILENCSLEYQESTDGWLYCVSDAWSDEIQRRSGYSACVEIFERDPFFIALADYLHPWARFLGVHRCHYIGRDLPHDYPLGSAIVKPEGYTYQREWRAIWLPHVQPQPAFNADIPGLVGKCRRVV